MPATQNIGNGVQVLDLGGIVQNATEMSRLALLKQQLQQEAALAPIKAQEAQSNLERSRAETTKFTLQSGELANKLQYQPQELQNQAQKQALDISNSISMLAQKAHEGLQNGDPYPAASYVRVITGNNSATIQKDPHGVGVYSAIDSQTQQPIMDPSTGQPWTYDAFAKEKSDPQIQANLAAKQAARNMAVSRMDISRKEFLERQAVNLANNIYNSSNRKTIGTFQQTITASNQLLALAARDGFNIPDNVDSLPPDQKQAIIAQLDKLPKAMVAEFAGAQAKLVQGGVPSDHGFSVLMPDSFRGKWQEMLSKFTNQPEGQQQGAFLFNYLSSAQRERNLARSNQINTVMGMAGPTAVMLRGDPYGRELFDATMSQFLRPPIQGEDQSTWLTPQSIKDAYDPQSDYRYNPPGTGPSAPTSPGGNLKVPNKAAPSLVPGVSPTQQYQRDLNGITQDYNQLLDQGLFNDQ